MGKIQHGILLYTFGHLSSYKNPNPKHIKKAEELEK